MNGISLRSPKGSTSSGQRSVEQPSCLPQRILDLGEVANRHNLEDKAVDFGFKILQGYGPGALPAYTVSGTFNLTR